MIAISLCMIVKNEENTLARCLESIRGAADEIVIVDTGSTDRTMEIARAFTPRVYGFEWTDDFSAARNFAFSKATKDYQMWLDADDTIEPGELEKLLRLKQTLPPDTDVVTMLYQTHFDESGQPAMTFARERLFRRESGFFWNDPVHEYVQMRGNIVKTDIAVRHMSMSSSGDRNLKIYEARLSRGEVFSPRSVYYYARELMDRGRDGEAAEQFERFLEGGKGWIEDNISACLALGGCYGRMGRRAARRRALLRSFEYDLPRPEICCELGYDYKEDGDFERAAYWFGAALKTPVRNNGGFSLRDCAGYIPHIELSVCQYNLGNLELAKLHNELADAEKPHSAPVAHNRRFFESLGGAE